MVSGQAGCTYLPVNVFWPAPISCALHCCYGDLMKAREATDRLLFFLLPWRGWYNTITNLAYNLFIYNTCFYLWPMIGNAILLYESCYFNNINVVSKLLWNEVVISLLTMFIIIIMVYSTLVESIGTEPGLRHIHRHTPFKRSTTTVHHVALHVNQPRSPLRHTSRSPARHNCKSTNVKLSLSCFHYAAINLFGVLSVPHMSSLDSQLNVYIRFVIMTDMNW